MESQPTEINQFILGQALRFPTRSYLFPSAFRNGLSMIPPPIPRHFKLSVPHALLTFASLIFLVNVLERILPIGQRPSFGNKPTVQVLVSEVACRQQTPVSILLSTNTPNRLSPNLVSQGKRSLLPASVWFSVQVADLPTFGSIDSRQADSLSVDFNRVAIDYRSSASDTTFLSRFGRRWLGGVLDSENHERQDEEKSGDDQSRFPGAREGGHHCEEIKKLMVIIEEIAISHQPTAPPPPQSPVPASHDLPSGHP